MIVGDMKSADTHSNVKLLRLRSMKAWSCIHPAPIVGTFEVIRAIKPSKSAISLQK